MSTFYDQNTLVTDTVRDYKDLAQSAYQTARQSLDTLQNNTQNLPLKTVNTDIGANANVTWTGVTIRDIPTDTIELTTEIDDLKAVMPKEVPPIPSTVVLPTETMPSGDTTDTFDEVIPNKLSGTFGDQVMPDSYWTGLRTEAESSISKEYVGKLRAARNRGAASWMPLPSESVLVASRQVSIDSAKALQEARLKIALEKARQGHDDFWKAADYDMKRYSVAVQARASNFNIDAAKAEFPLKVATTKVGLFKTQYDVLNTTLSGIAALTNSRVATKKMPLDVDTAKVELAKLQNDAEIEVAKLDQAAQEASVKIDVAQAQWIEGQSNAMTTRISELAFGYTQALVSASHVNLSAGATMSIDQNVNASQNSPISWHYFWNEE